MWILNNSEAEEQKLYATVAQGVQLLANGDFNGAYQFFSVVVDEASRLCCTAPWSEDLMDPVLGIGNNITRRGFALLGAGDFWGALADFGLGALIGCDPITPMCMLCSIRATSDNPDVRNPSLAHVISTSAIWYSIDSPTQLPLAQLYRGIALSALESWDAAEAQFEQIQVHDRKQLEEYDEYVAAARERRLIRRTSDEFAARTQLVFQRLLSQEHA